MSKQNPETENKVISAISSGMTYRAASHLAGISEDTLRRWREDDAAFAARLRDAIEARYTFLLDTFISGFAKNPASSMKLLQSYHPNEFGNKVAVTGPDNGPINVRTVSVMTDEDLRALVSAGKAQLNGKQGAD